MQFIPKNKQLRQNENIDEKRAQTFFRTISSMAECHESTH